MVSQTNNLPPELSARLQIQLGEQFDAFQKAMISSSPISIRLNPNKPTASFKQFETVPWCSNGRYLDSRPRFTDDPLFHAGTYYVQEASSMFLEYLLTNLIDLTQDLRVLDLSAAPGGKSTLLQSLLTQDSLLVANEVISSRNKVLHQNMVRWGGDNHIITQSDPRHFKKLPDFFDVILVDAPCSGEGLMRKEPSAMQEWSQQNVLLCAARQKRILADVLPALASGGTLIYSTCTFSEEENEQNMAWLHAEASLIPTSVSPPASWGVHFSDSNLATYRFYPHLVKGEGFFIAAFKKAGETSSRPLKKHKKPQKFRTETVTSEDQYWLAKPDRYFYQTRDQHRIAFPKSIFGDYLELSKAIRITHSGLNMGKVYHDKLKPSPELALSQFVSTELPTIDLDIESALDYLAHINLSHFETPEAGRYLVTYNGFGLGWMNVLKTGQIRNNYPSAWRILQRYRK